MGETILSGMRPTGRLHIGHYVGVIESWLELQEQHDCFLFLADWHALTSEYKSVDVINKSRYEYVKGWLASGVDPNKAHIYNQSAIPEVMKIFQFFLCLTPPGWADRSPSWKDQVLNPKKHLDNLGFYTYPILQTADVALVNGTLIPVGEDQVAHIEICRDLIKKFNRLYNAKLFVPGAKLTKNSKLCGTDGRPKMSSSLGNVITLEETEKSLQKKINKMVTDDQREGINSPGNPDNCSVFSYHKVFSAQGLIGEVDKGCRSAQLGCGECKKKLGGCMKDKFMPIAEKIKTISNQDCDDILNEGNKYTQKVAKESWQKICESTGF